MIKEKQILADMDEQKGFFTLDDIEKDYVGVSGAKDDDFLYLVQWLLDLENVGKIYRIRHNNEDYYITPENFQKIIREQNLLILMGLSPV